LIKLAKGWLRRGEVNDDQAKEIVYHAKNAAVNEWRPLVYVIPRAPVEARLKPVPADRRAGLGNEWTLEETLAAAEFDIIEL
jgi:hypothetical protein